MNLGGHTGHTGHTGYTGLWRFSTGCTVQFRKYTETTSGYFAGQLVYSMISIPPQAISVQSAVGSNHKGPNGLSYTWYVREETVTSSDM